MDSRNITGSMVEELIRNHRAYTEAKKKAGNIGPDTESERGVGEGVEAGSFVDLLVNGKDKATGAPFSDNVLAQQADFFSLFSFDWKSVSCDQCS